MNFYNPYSFYPMTAPARQGLFSSITRGLRGIHRSLAVGSNLNVEFGLLFKGFYYVKFLSFLCCVSL